MSQPLLAVEALTVHFPSRRGLVHAVDRVSFEIGVGETLGLVGESGCGKSTLCKAIVGIAPVKEGRIALDGETISGLGRRALRRYRRALQMIFQDPNSSLNPRRTVGRIIEEPLIVHGMGSAAARRGRVVELLAKVGLGQEAANRYPHEFSGGQRQRIGIARALALSPKLIVCDEPVSALDVSVQAQVVNLLIDLQTELGISYLFVSHDLSVVRHIAHRVGVMYLGELVEYAPAQELFQRPLHPYTQRLIAAVPTMDIADEGSPLLDVSANEDEVPSPVDPPSGCRYRTRCPWTQAICAERAPDMKVLPGARRVACHFVEVDAAGQISAPGT
jgi:oligopeptide/dipeptide ABC transporter ATP-binding protein